MKAVSPPRVLIFSDESDHYVPKLQQRFPEVAVAACNRYADLELSLAQFKPTVALGCKFEKTLWPRDTFFASPSLQWLSVTAAGIEHVAPWDETKVTVTNFSGIAATEIAQYVLAAIFGLHQGFAHFFAQQARKNWDYQLIRQARGITVGLVGLGHSGIEIAKHCRAVGLKVVAYRSSAEPSEAVDRVYSGDEFHEMLGAVDVTVACAALTPKTSNMFDAAAFAAMKPASYFINVGRGKLVVEADLIAALLSGHLAAAQIDVAHKEPLPADDPLWDAPNLLITPHSCSDFIGWEAVAADLFADNLQRWINGEPLINQVYASRGY
jgi:phosphoglycerate dehydrogenase-like enzyme